VGKRFLSGQVAIESFRYNGFSSTANALAELIDNSIQASAKQVEIGVVEEFTLQVQRERLNVKEITVLDNGVGMSPKTLELAMEFGGSENRNDKGGMGKFGMGLPNSSISQCRRVDVWSWQGGMVPSHTYLDIDEMLSGNLEEIPVSQNSPIPQYLLNSHFGIGEIGTSGTLVRWSKLDMITWKTSSSILKHCESIVGRMYRRYLDTGRVTIDFVTYQPVDKAAIREFSRSAFRSNDPLYLMKNTTLDPLPGQYKNEAFFELVNEAKVPISYKDGSGQVQISNVIVRSSIIKKTIADEIRKTATTKLGATIWGTHCAQNMGISIVRADRELILKNILVKKELKEYKGRFFGVEVCFGPELDRLFGVLNNKQDAVNFLDYDFKELALQNGFDSEIALHFDTEDFDDVIVAMKKVITEVKSQFEVLYTRIDKIQIDPISPVDGEDEDANERASKVASLGDQDGEPPPSDEGKISDFLTEQGIEGDVAEKSKSIKLKGLKYWIDEQPQDTDAFFSVHGRDGLTLVTLNKSHRYYEQLICQLPEQQKVVMEVAIAAFAYVHQKTTDPKERDHLNSVRRNWGKVLQTWLAEVDER